MFTRAGTQLYPTPVFNAAETTAGGGSTDTVVAGGGVDTTQGSEGSDTVVAGNAFEGLEADNLAWLQTTKLTDPKALAKHAFNQEKLLGSAIRVPKEGAPQEEVDAYLNKLGRPEKVEGYEFAAPKGLPEGLPYDGEVATAFKAEAHKLGLNKTQAAALHDWYVQQQVAGFTKYSTEAAGQLQERANKATEGLVKLWGPIDGKTAQANFEIANRVFTQVPGGQELLAELKELKVVGPKKEILSVPLAKALAAIGTALFTEDGVLRGQTDKLDNPFSDANHNVTKQMQIVSKNPDEARSLIAAAGKKPEDFGLKP